MSWEYEKYEARCESCGKTGFCIRGSDDWNRSSTRWEGFEEVAPSSTAVGMKHADARNLVGQCDCGKSKIVLGSRVE